MGERDCERDTLARSHLSMSSSESMSRSSSGIGGGVVARV